MNKRAQTVTAIYVKLETVNCVVRTGILGSVTTSQNFFRSVLSLSQIEMLAHLRRAKLAKAVIATALPGRFVPMYATGLRSYHSYPDPDEKPVIQTNQSTYVKTHNKEDPKFQLDQKHKLDKIFPGVVVSSGIGSTQQPPTLTSILDSGLSVASQEMPGMMTSIALIVRAGR